MKIIVTWVTLRGYPASIDTAELLRHVTGTGCEPEARAAEPA
jgi:hypothetical protein